MKLSERAKNYFNKQKRIAGYYTSRDKTITYCNNQGFFINERLLEIQESFSGYKLTITNNKGDGFLLSLFSNIEIENNYEIEVYSFGKMYVTPFGTHDTAPFQFYITNLGAICTLGSEEGEIPNVVCSSVEVFIEQYALKDELALQTEKGYYYDVLDTVQLQKLLHQNFIKIEECSDQYSLWFTGNKLTIVMGTWLGSPTFYLHVYGETKESGYEFINYLKLNEIIS